MVSNYRPMCTTAVQKLSQHRKNFCKRYDDAPIMPRRSFIPSSLITYLKMDTNIHTLEKDGPENSSVGLQHTHSMFGQV